MTLVLGAGPVGLLAARLLRAEAVVGAEVGGSATLRSLAPTFLWRTPWTERLVHDLGLLVDPTEVRFGWICPFGVKDAPDELDLEIYLSRSRGKGAARPPSLGSSGLPGRLPTFNLGVDELVERLLDQVEVTRAEVLRIDFPEDGERVHVELRDGATLESSAVVNTLPAPVWDRLTPAVGSIFERRVWPAGTKWFVTGDAYRFDLAEEADDPRGRAYLYVSDPKLPFDRVKIRRWWSPGERFVYEFNREPPASFVAEVGGELAWSGPAQVIGAPRDAYEWNGLVWHLGRLARWDHRVRLHDVTEEVYRAIA